jgi:hypothetical protein
MARHKRVFEHLSIPTEKNSAVHRYKVEASAYSRAIVESAVTSTGQEVIASH